MRTRALAASVTVLAASAGSLGSIVVHDNSQGLFVLGAGLNRLDLTMPPDQQQSPVRERSITYTAGSGGGSDSPQGDGVNGGSGVRIVQNPVPLVITSGTGGMFIIPLAQTFGPGEPIGPSFIYASGGAMALFHIAGGAIHAPLLGQSPFTGFSLTLDDGVHYGWIQWNFSMGPARDSVPIPMYQPIRWAYETEPNVPIVVPAPATATLLALAGLVATRRRRSDR